MNIIQGGIGTDIMSELTSIPCDGAPIMGVDRHRIGSDGKGITTLVAFFGCPLKCKFCLNPECHKSSSNWMSPQELYDLVKIDDIYFRAYGGGITFGGGEPLLYNQFITDFYNLCEGRWNINIESSLNVPLESISECISIINTLFVDLKCYDNKKYISYTGKSNRKVLRNLQWLSENGHAYKVIIRIPNIPGYTDNQIIADSVDYCKSFGYNHIDLFDYVLPSAINQERDKRTANGKKICDVLKQIRLQVAKDNGLNLTIPICTYEGPCKGTCPRCDAELHNLTTYINVLENNNVKIIL